MLTLQPTDIDEDVSDPKLDLPPNVSDGDHDHIATCFNPISLQEQEPNSPDTPKEQKPKPPQNQQGEAGSNLYEELKDSPYPYATCRRAPGEISVSKTVQSHNVLVEPKIRAPLPNPPKYPSHPAHLHSAGLKYRNFPLGPVRQDKPTKYYSLSTSEEYEDMTHQVSSSGAYDVPTKKGADVFDDPAGVYTYIPNNVRKARSMPRPLSASKQRLYSTIEFSGHLQGADPTATLQLRILQQMQEVLAQMHATYGQTQLQPKVETQGPSSALEANMKPNATAQQNKEILSKCNINYLPGKCAN